MSSKLLQVCKTDFTYFRDKSLRQPSLNPLIAMPFVWENQVKREQDHLRWRYSTVIHWE